VPSEAICAFAYDHQEKKPKASAGQRDVEKEEIENY